MTIAKYYIEDTVTGDCLLNDGEWAPFLPENEHKEFTVFDDAVTEIDTLTEGTYRVFARFYKD